MYYMYANELHIIYTRWGGIIYESYNIEEVKRFLGDHILINQQEFEMRRCAESVQKQGLKNPIVIRNWDNLIEKCK